MILVYVLVRTSHHHVQIKKILRKASDFKKNISQQEPKCPSLIYGGTISHASNFSNVICDNIEFYDYKLQELTQLYYTKEIKRDGMLMKELLTIGNAMNVKPNWYGKIH